MPVKAIAMLFSFAALITSSSRTEPPGWITAVDADIGALRWKYHTEGAAIAGVTPTAGGILMTGDAKGDFFVIHNRSRSN